MTTHERSKGLSILVVEDEYLQAKDVSDRLVLEGATVVGPFATVEGGMRALHSANALDAAVLDVNLWGAMIFDLADVLRMRGIPFMFATGYDRQALPHKFRSVSICEKPYSSDDLVRRIELLCASG